LIEDVLVHELSLVQALLSQIGAVARANGATAVRRVTVQIGPLSGIDAALLASAFAAARGTGFAARAELSLECLPVRVRCRDCGTDSDVAPNRLLCGQCGGYRTTLLSGDEMILQRVELSLHASPDAA
jgi:hydrogenase nickel incorporation protein HypA/HybF